MMKQPAFLPMSKQECKSLEIEQLDIILISGDAYVDHPSFGAALIGRVLWDAGYTVGIIAQPDWKRDEDFLRLGRPRLFFGITSGNVDSMVNNLTPNLKRRSSDVYSPGGALRRPDRALIVYANKVHALFPGVPLILGGIEASLRRFAHYDYWSDSVRQSILADAPGDLLIYGMGENPLKEMALRLEKGERADEIRDVAGTAVKDEVSRWKNASPRSDCLIIPSFSDVSTDKKKYAKAFALHYGEQDPFHGRVVVQAHPKTIIIQNRPARPLASAELDSIYELPFRREAHPSYKETIPALEPVRFSITSHRGCFGSCSFCALTHHQGRIVQSRSIDSIMREAAALTNMRGFKGIIQDVGGPTANMYGLVCARWKSGACRDKLCSADCPSLDTDHSRQVELLRRLRSIPGVRRVFIGSGIRHDLIMADSKSSNYLHDSMQHHVCDHLKIAPEHISSGVTACMNKPPKEVLDAFRERFKQVSKEIGKEQYILPYLMSGHPGCTISDMIELAEYLRDHHMYTEQVQDFTPSPMTVSTAMYYTGLDPFTLESIHVPKGREKKIQRALLQYRDPRNYDLVKEGLREARRGDLIGEGRRCLIPARFAPTPGVSRRPAAKKRNV
ncbi:MAG: YgiQ family radical SAM protein [Methanothrix sp.]|nr:MAG: YgiQ family radical SAM protein [Methanothrix sp.]